MMFSFSFVGGAKSAEGGPYPLADLDWGGQIRWDTGIFEMPKDIDDFIIGPLTDQISVLGEIVVPIVDVGCQKKCPAW